jgi:CubicO group peptidase (beta-lactamase class C family)
MRKALSTASAIAAFLTAGLAAQQPSVYAPLGGIPVLETYLESLRAQAGIPGMSAAIVHDGVIIWERGYGFQNTVSHIRATPDTPYVVGDLSETIAAIVLLECADERKIELDQPVSKYGVEGEAANATVRQLLSHTRPETPDEPFVYAPQRYAQLTRVAEFCTDQPYRKAAAARVLERAAMYDSVPGLDMRRPAGQNTDDEWFDTGDYDRYRRVLDGLALPYKVDSRGRVDRTELPPTAMNAAGGLISTVRDLAKLDAALDSELLLRTDTRTIAWTQVVSSTNVAAPTGLGWFVQWYRNEQIVWHFGLVPNAYSALILKLPARNLTFILLANSDRLSSPFSLESGDVTRSVFATLFLRFVT